MDLWDATKSLFSGNFKDAANYLAVDNEEVNRGRDLDAQLSALNARDLASNKIDETEYNRRVGELQSNAFEHGGIFDQEGTDIAGGFASGAVDGLKSIQQGVKSGLANSINFGFGFIPWQVWVLAAIYAGFRLGLFDGILKGKVKA